MGPVITMPVMSLVGSYIVIYAIGYLIGRHFMSNQQTNENAQSANLLEVRVTTVREKMDHVYVVGSDEYHFVCDRAFAGTDEGRADAIAYCDSRQNTKHEWIVMQAPLGAMWFLWKEIHRTKRN